MYLAPTATPDADIGRFDRVGIWVNLGQGGMVVMDVAAGSPADSAGLKVGDVITAIGSTPTAGQSLSDVRRSLKLLPVSQKVTVAFIRDGAEQTCEIVPRDLIPD